MMTQTQMGYLRVLAVGALVLAAGVLATIAWLDRTTIAYLNISRIMQETSIAKQARESLASEKERLEAELKVLEDSVATQVERMKGAYDGADEGSRMEMRIELERRNRNVARYSRAIEEKLVAKDREVTAPVLARINGLLERYREKQGLDIILGTAGTGNIVAAESKLDITDHAINWIERHAQPE